MQKVDPTFIELYETLHPRWSPCFVFSLRGVVCETSLADAWRQIWRKELLCSFINAFLYFNLVA